MPAEKKMKIIREKGERRAKEEEEREFLRGKRYTWDMISRRGMEQMRTTGRGHEGEEQKRKIESQQKGNDGVLRLALPQSGSPPLR